MGSHTSLKTSVNASPDIGPDKSVSCARNCIGWQIAVVSLDSLKGEIVIHTHSCHITKQ